MSLIALLSAGSAIAGEPIKTVTTGAAGRNASITFGAFRNAATPGGDANGVSEDVSGAISDVSGTAIQLGTRGGRGGNGEYSPLSPNEPGAAGGKAGDVSLTFQGTQISGSGDHDAPMPLIWLYAIGGTGGNGFQQESSGHGLGAGGAAGNVTFSWVDYRTWSGYWTSTITTTGTAAPAIYLRSEGGDAGGGRDNPRGGTFIWDYDTEAGAAGGTVTATLGSTTDASYRRQLTTFGESSPGLVAMSRGGDGGTANWTGGDTYYATNGGAGGRVEVVNNGQVRTHGDGSAGLVLQSIGGRGGNGGGGAWSPAAPGAAGGNGGAVSATNAGTVWTSGAFSFGIAAQSVGGEGGTGQNSAFGEGGAGGAAGAGGKVTVTTTTASAIDTGGVGATAILAQSIGGGNALDAFRATEPAVTRSGGGSGGQGGILFFSSGGEGGNGGVGGAVSVSHEGAIGTQGDAALGVLAQSVGGGGGTGGKSVVAGSFLTVALGGTGGGGGDGGKVAFESARGRILTSGRDASAVLVQSIGGGGGSGGKAAARTIGEVISVGVAIGGAGGGGGRGGEVRARTGATIATAGDRSKGLEALSVGGGGGNGGGADSLSIALPSSLLPTKPVPSVAASISLGGSGGSGGDGGTVSVENSGAITTRGTQSTGIHAQSTGGGGGDGGGASAYSLAVAPPGQSALTLSLGIGGSGGGGGAGGSVTVRNEAGATVATSGERATALHALSVGGGGGMGGGASTVSNLLGLYRNLAATIVLGGRGGGGGDGGKVDVLNAGELATTGDFSFGLVAQSVGGGGGDAGTVETSTKVGLSFSDVADKLTSVLTMADSMAFTIALGGRGGDGGSGGEISTRNSGRILTSGNNATALFAQSVGGGGGSAGGYQGGGEGTANLELTLGGRGGGGGNGGAVTVRNSAGALIETTGAGSHGILAQSVGGGGGSGGGFAGDTSAVSGTSGTLEFLSRVSQELIGYNDILVKYGNKGIFSETSKTQTFLGAVKDYMGAVDVLLDKDKGLAEKLSKAGFLVTLKTLQLAYKAKLEQLQSALQSGDARSLPDISLKVVVGGSGGAGGVGGAVDIANAGAIRTSGALAFGILAQSIGGGGGAGGSAVSDGQNKLNLALTVGGRGGSSNNQTGGRVDVANSGGIETSGNAAFGLFAQSVGGGGGVGGGTGNSDAISLSARLGVGGSGGQGQHGGAVTVSNTGSLLTHGDGAHALVAQSVGGGGGMFYLRQIDPSVEATETFGDLDAQTRTLAIAAYQVTLAVLKKLGVEATNPSTYDATTTIVPTVKVNYSLGGDGTVGGNGGAVTVQHKSGSISTEGDGAFGILAQSIGGGGGLGADATTKGGEIQRTAISGLNIGGSGGAAGNGGAVSVELGPRASVATSGEGASALFLQSIGGGGGFGGVGDNASTGLIPVANMIGSGGASGNGGAISVSVADGGRPSILATGTGASGIFAQSLGGGGGAIIGLTGAAIPVWSMTTSRSGVSGTGGRIDIALGHATVQATGRDAYGVFLQSGRQKADGVLDTIRGGDIRLTTAGRLTGGSGGGAAIRIDGGDHNEIRLQSGAEVWALSGQAIIAGSGEDRLVNEGLLRGNVDLSAGNTREDNSFTNAAGGTYIFGTSAQTGILNLGTYTKLGLFRNEGLLSVAGEDTIGVAQIRNAESVLGGTLVADVNSTTLGVRTADVLNAGYVRTRDLVIRPNAVDGLLPGDYRVLNAHYLTLAGGASALVSSASPISWQISADSTSLDIRPQANFRLSPYATDTERSLLAALQDAWQRNDDSTQVVAGLYAQFANVRDEAEYMRAIDSLASSEAENQSAVIQTLDARKSLRASMSCPAFEGTGTLLQEGECVWSRVTGSRTAQFSSSDGEGYTQNAMSYRIGGQWELAPDWFLGATAAYGTSWYRAGDGLSTGAGKGGDISLALKRQMGPWLFAGALHGGYGTYDSTSQFIVGDDRWAARNSSDVWTSGLALRAAYEFAFTNWYLRPYADLDVLYTNMPGYTLAGPTSDLDVGSLNQWTVAFSPAIELGGRFNLGESGWLRPYATLGATFLGNDSLDTGVTLAGVGKEAGKGIDFTSTSSMPNALLDVGGGVQLLAGNKYELRSEYKAQMADHFLNQELSLRVGLHF